MPQTTPDILENDILRRWPEVLRALLKDQTTKRNIFWATDMYEKEYGESYAFRHQITVEQITGDNGVDSQSANGCGTRPSYLCDIERAAAIVRLRLIT